MSVSKAEMLTKHARQCWRACKLALTVAFPNGSDECTRKIHWISNLPDKLFFWMLMQAGSSRWTVSLSQNIWSVPLERTSHDSQRSAVAAWFVTCAGQWHGRQWEAMHCACEVNAAHASLCLTVFNIKEDSDIHACTVLVGNEHSRRFVLHVVNRVLCYTRVDWEKKILRLSASVYWEAKYYIGLPGWTDTVSSETIPSNKSNQAQ